MPFVSICCIYICDNHEMNLTCVQKIPYIRFSNGTQQLIIMLGFCEYYDIFIFRNVHIYIHMFKSLIIFSDFLTVKNLIIKSWMCTSNPHEKLLLHKEILRLEADSVWLYVCQVLPS